MIDLKFAFRSMIDRSRFDRSDRSFSRIVWPLVYMHEILFTDIDLHLCKNSIDSVSPHLIYWTIDKQLIML